MTSCRPTPPTPPASMSRSHTGDLADEGAAAALIANASGPDLSIWPASCRARQRRISISATASISTARGRCSTPSAWRPMDPRVVYTSSIAVFGAPFPDVIPDDFHPTPLTSYGTQKLIGEADPGWTTRDAASSMASASACPPSACGPASRTRRRPASFPVSSASRWRARRLSCRAAHGRAHPCQPALGGQFPDARRRDRRERDRPAPQPHHARRGVDVGEQIEALEPSPATLS
jgi:hypothetical protein